MPKVKISDAKGIRQVGGKGFLHLSDSDKGFMRQVESATISSGIATDTTLDTGIDIPANAVVEMLAIKLVSEYADGSGSISDFELKDFRYGGETFTLDLDGDNTANGIDFHEDQTPTEGSVWVFYPSAIDLTATVIRDKAAPAASTGSVTDLTLNLTVNSGTGASDDTQAVLQVLVQYMTPVF